MRKSSSFYYCSIRTLSRPGLNHSEFGRHGVFAYTGCIVIWIAFGITYYMIFFVILGHLVCLMLYASIGNDLPLLLNLVCLPVSSLLF